MKLVTGDRNKGLRRLLKILTIDTAIAFLPPLLLLVVAFDHVSFLQVLNSFLFSLVFAHIIGGLNFAIVPHIWGCAPGWPAWIRWSVRSGVILVNTVVGSLFVCLVIVALGWIPPELYWVEFFGSLKIAILISILAGVSIGTYESFQWRLQDSALQLRTKELERERALKLATEAQLASLESRIHPHFLFNTLNSISSLIPEDPQRAERLVEQMAALLRFSLDANQAGLVPLADELKIVTDYLEIERARFGERLHYQIEVAPDLGAAKVPPLAVQTLVENSVKYAIAPSRAGGEIRIAGRRENGRVRIEVSDPGPEFALEFAPAGHGLDNLMSRLTTLFGSQGAPALERHNNRNTVMFSVPLNGNHDTRISG